jgi:trimethylguanosine synthase
VYAIEKNPAVLQCAKHNAKIYGVDDKITWFEGDCFEILKNQLKDLAPYSIIFASPPWGGLSSSQFPCEVVTVSNCVRCWVSVG